MRMVDLYQRNRELYENMRAPVSSKQRSPLYSNKIKDKNIQVLGPAGTEPPLPDAMIVSLGWHYPEAEIMYVNGQEMDIEPPGRNDRVYCLKPTPRSRLPQVARSLMSCRRARVCSVPHMGTGHPNKLQIALYDLLVNGTQKPYVSNVDFFLGPYTRIGENAREKFRKCIDRPPWKGFILHDALANFAYVKALLRKEYIECSSAVGEILKLGVDEYAERLDAIA